MAVKRVTVRVSRELHRRITQAAAKRHVSLNQFVTEALDASAGQHESSPLSPDKLRELSALLAPAAEAKGLSEEELLRHLREVRQRIWKERYQEAVRAVSHRAR
ncbi:MAG: toxin-antitoxin system HicB family antitoxin [Acidobacteria bacterium]|nr:toxin-antitoxin system HicB family antitoxin [Acidobacteriota bacterium]